MNRERIKLRFWQGAGPVLTGIAGVFDRWWDKVRGWIDFCLAPADARTAPMPLVNLLAWERGITRLFGEPENLYRLRKKRLPTFSEYCSILHGHPEGAAVAGGADPLTAGGHSGPDGKRFVSDIGVEDGAGVWWQWLDDMGPSGVWVPDQAVNGKYNGKQLWKSYDDGGGRMYGGVFALRAGGAWDAAQTDAAGYSGMNVIDSSLQAYESDGKTTARGVAAAYHG